MTQSRRLEEYYAYVEDDPQERQHPGYSSAMLVLLVTLLAGIAIYASYQAYWMVKNKKRLDVTRCVTEDLMDSSDVSTELSNIPPGSSPPWANTVGMQMAASVPQHSSSGAYVTMGEQA